MRYTEVRMDKPAAVLLEDIEKETVSFQQNYDGKEKNQQFCQPNIPTCWSMAPAALRWAWRRIFRRIILAKVVDATLAMIDDPEITDEQLIEIVPGPDFPRGRLSSGRPGPNPTAQGQGLGGDALEMRD